MIIPKGWYLEVHHPVLGYKAHYVLRYLTQRESKAAKIPTRQCAQMTNLYVHPAHRGQGIGSELLRHLRHWQRSTGTDVVFLVSPYSRDCYLDIWGLKNFYSENGFPEIKGTAYHGHMIKRK